jgi:glutathione synthase/RimK-type ligase-like ATP-grasp enzyme
MCASLKKIYNEYRYFVVDGKVVTGSQYKLGKRVVYGETDQNIDIAQTFVDMLNKNIDQPYVIDIALTDDGYKVIELNTMNCAGFYACDMQKLVTAIIDYEHK